MSADVAGLESAGGASARGPRAARKGPRQDSQTCVTGRSADLPVVAGRSFAAWAGGREAARARRALL